ncbi:hypothetical protein C5167_006322 [Papaver somniferum]|uniref:Uncharacterized protein n=1 Tax=Papaver somniferum TaxID=3469 RepID=A0A4Y7JDX3_PAPSO|nr:hypothetical protein C5167_006322 [Papaver somniferum]
MQKLNYCNKDISEDLLRGKEAPKSALEASCAVSVPDRHSRRTSHGNSVNLKVSGSMWIYQLK